MSHLPAWSGYYSYNRHDCVVISTLLVIWWKMEKRFIVYISGRTLKENTRPYITRSNETSLPHYLLSEFTYKSNNVYTSKPWKSQNSECGGKSELHILLLLQNVPDSFVLRDLYFTFFLSKTVFVQQVVRHIHHKLSWADFVAQLTNNVHKRHWRNVWLYSSVTLTSRTITWLRQNSDNSWGECFSWAAAAGSERRIDLYCLRVITKPFKDFVIARNLEQPPDVCVLSANDDSKWQALVRGSVDASGRWTTCLVVMTGVNAHRQTLTNKNKLFQKKMIKKWVSSVCFKVT